MEQIRNIIFDLGNVLFDLDIPRTESMMRALLKEEYEQVHEALLRRNIFEQYEKGLISEESFLWAFQHSAQRNLDPRDLIQAWNAMLIGFPAHRFSFLEKIGKRYRIFLFSNTNETHLRWVQRHFKSDHVMQDFDTRFFEKTFFSNLIHHKKPDVEAFQFVLTNAGIRAEETLFIDDLADNVRGAREAGIHTIHHQPGREVAEEMQSFY